LLKQYLYIHFLYYTLKKKLTTIVLK
jgi:hypothetical protein